MIQLTKPQQTSDGDTAAVEEVSILANSGQSSYQDMTCLHTEAAIVCALQLLEAACSSICEHLLDFLTNRYATHVARRLLCIIAGRDVLPIAAKSQNKVCPIPSHPSCTGQTPMKTCRYLPPLHVQLLRVSRHCTQQSKNVQGCVSCS